MTPILKAENLCKSFKSGEKPVRVLNNICVSINPGSLTILKGRSGSGKTTLINILGALDRPTEGKVYFENSDVTKMSDDERDELRRTQMGFVFQSVAVIPTMSAYENVDFALRVAGFKDDERDALVRKSLASVGLSKRMDHMANELSGGEQQRVAIARAIVHKPRIVFADEPTAQLDTGMGIQIMKLFVDLVKNEKVTIVMTTHDPAIMELADNLVELDEGKTEGEDL